MYRIILGEEDIPITNSNKIFKNNSYINKVLRTSVANVNKDKKR